METRPLSLSLLKRSQFPALRHLDICYASDPNPQIPDEIVESPAVQTLGIFGYKPLDPFKIVLNFGKYLRELRVIITDHTFFSNQYTIHLPQLEILWLDARRSREDSIMPTMVTPGLKKLVAKSLYPTQSFPLQMDLGRLVHLRICCKQKPPLSALRGLKVLRFDFYSSSYNELFEPLMDDPSICPNLETVEIFADREGYPDLMEMIPRINRFRGSDIMLFFLARHQILPQLLIHIHPCGCDMPCYVDT